MVVVSWMVMGVMIGMQVEGWGFLTSLYVITQIVTTVGYGDITVHTQSMKLFMTVYVLGCLVFIAFLTNKYADRVLQKNSEFFQAQMSRVEARLKGPQGSSFWSSVLNVLAACGGFLFFVGAGTLYYALMEPCSCSYGVTRVQGCDMEYCVETGGYTKTWVDAYYMSVITLTTVGFGDHSPRSFMGRAFGICWMIFGVISTAHLITTAGEFFHQEGLGQGQHFKLEVSEEKLVQDFGEVDHDGKGYFTQAEFMEYILLKYKLVETDDLELIRRHFEELDKNGNGHITHDEVRSAYEQQ